MLSPSPVRFEDRLRLQLALQGLSRECGVYATREGQVGCVAPRPLSDDECARLLRAWTSTSKRVR